MILFIMYLPKYTEFLEITYRYPLIIELERLSTFKGLFLSLFCFYEKNKSNTALSLNQEFKLVISSLGYDLLYDYDREYSDLFKKDKETVNLVQAF
jgi:hypothetical protein